MKVNFEKEVILRKLEANNPQARIALDYSNPVELLIAVILSAQCTDKRVNIITKKLFAKYPTLKDYLKTNQRDFENDIRSAGFYHSKAKNILTSLKIIHEKFDGKVPDNFMDILTLPGVARKTANVVLGNAYGVVEGIAVDTHVLRISQRLRLVDIDCVGGKKIIPVNISKTDIDYYRDANPEKIESLLMKSLPRDIWFKFTYWIIDLGRSLCKALKPQCGNCYLAEYCPVRR